MIKFRKTKEKEPKKPYGITDEFIDEINAYSTDQKKAALVRLQNDQSKTEFFLKTNETIVDLKEQLKQIKGPSNDTIKSVKNRISFILEQFKQQGIVL